ncbi:MAG: hypothetical protein IKK94_04925, partial [Clostridia bacterium]|nr:hypothetical protein [Clostridia bacterium]
QGAAVATLACYIIVYIIRSIDTQRYEKFSTKSFIVLLNTLIVAFQCVTMLCEVKLWWLWGACSVIAIAIINFGALFSSIKTVLHSVFLRFKK